MDSNRAAILIVMHGAGEGGVEKSVKILCKYIDKEKFRVVVALPSEGPLKSYLDTQGITTIVTPLDTWTPIPFNYGERHYYQFLFTLKERVRALVSVIKEHNIDVVHSATLSVADGAFAAKVAGVPHLWHIHGKSVGTTKAYGSYLPVATLYALVNDLSASIIAVSHDVREFLWKYLPDASIPVIWNGLDMEEFDVQAQGSSIRQEFCITEHDRLVVIVGRVAQVKGVDDFIESAAKVLEQRDRVAFLVVGPDEDQELAGKLKSRVRELDRNDKIIFTGRRNDIPAILREADLVVCSSRTEGFPYSVLEAMAAAKPVVTTRCGGPQEMVVDGETGFHVDVGSPDQMAARILTILDDEQLMRSMGAKGRGLIEREFDAKCYVKKLEELYGTLSDREKLSVNPWGEVILDLVSAVGALGNRTRHLEHEVRDLRGFEAMFKDNALFRGAKTLISSIKR